MVTKSSTCKGKSGALYAYSSKLEAERAATDAKIRYGQDISPYLCARCNLWHLSPKDRQTPSKECICPGSNGKHKQLYETKEAAETRARIILEERGEKLNIYPCPRRNGWHLTHKGFGY